MEFEHFETNLEKENEYPKLVRDSIPEVVEKITGKKIETRILENDREYLQFLLKKIEEESQELSKAKEKEHIIEELADIVELIDAIIKFEKTDWETVREVQKKKAEERGGFEKRILMLKKVD